jgi:hypothetical protein
MPVFIDDVIIPVWGGGAGERGNCKDMAWFHLETSDVLPSRRSDRRGIPETTPLCPVISAWKAFVIILRQS